MMSPRLWAAVAISLATPAVSQDIESAISLSASSPDMLMRAAVAACMAHQEDLTKSIDAFSEAGWGSDTDDGGLTTLFQDEVVVFINPDIPLCRIESSVLGFAEAGAIASDLVVLAHGGTATEQADDDGCPYVISSNDEEDWLSISTGGSDPGCAEVSGAGVAITVING